jgi:hypothetical protein
MASSRWTAGYNFKTVWNGDRVTVIWTQNIGGTEVGLSQDYKVFSLLTELPPSCPPEAYPDYSHPKINENGFVEACYNPFDLAQADSCNLNDGGILPAGSGENSAEACLPKEDGSMCHYTYDSGVYVASEGTCYGENVPPDYVDQPAPNPTGEDCEPMSTGQLVCPSDPDDVCPDGICPPNCGYFNDQFVCIDADSDADGIQDYDDPDIDGDGIPNGDDLDADGDGVDDRISDGGIGGPAQIGPIDVVVDVNVEVDNSGVIAELQAIKSILGDSSGIPDANSMLSAADADRTQAIGQMMAESAKNDGLVSGYMSAEGVTAMVGVPAVASLVGAESACTNITMFQHELDICSKAELITTVLNYILWALTLAFSVWRFRAMISGGSD